jgi:predicted metalloprotease with PDZ domain
MHHMVARKSALLLAVFVMQIPLSAAQTAPEAIRYTVSFPAPQTNYFEVSAAVPTDGRPEVELMMAVWTPGSYLIREYSRNVESVTATGQGGRALAVEKSDKNRWRVATGGAPSVTVKYRVYAREMSVRTNWVEADFAMINGAPTFMTLVGGLQRPHEVVIEPARAWRTSLTSLSPLPGGSHRYRAADYDELVDSPILIGNPAVYEFTVDDKKHYLANIGESGVFDGVKAARDLEAIVREQRRFWGSLPYDRYIVMNVLTAVPGQIAGGGLEHKNSTLLIAGRWATRTRQSYLAWLELASHEMFHAWNVKRLRPVELGPFDYENENFTRSLWLVEGVTDYYGELLVHRAGLSTQVEYLDALSNKIEEVQTTPGRTVQSAELASQDAWIKYYRPDENSPNSSVSYYAKGAVLAFVLDAKIRKATAGAKALDDVMRAAYQKFSARRGYTPDEFRAVAEQVAGASLGSFWDAAIEGTAEIDYAEALDLLGLRFRPVAASQPARAWLGATTRNDAGRLVVTQVRRDGPAGSPRWARRRGRPERGRRNPCD